MNKEDFKLKNISEHVKWDSHSKPLLLTGAEHEVLVLPYNFGHPEMFMRKIKTNEKFMEVVGGGSSSWGQKQSWSFQNVYAEHETLDRFFKMYSDGSLGFLQKSSVDHEFMVVKRLSAEDIKEMQYMPLPPSQIFEYVLENPQKGITITVDRPEIHWDYDKFRVHIFTQSNGMYEQLKVTNVARYRDGGTTEITTEKGFLYCPTPWKKEEKHTWTPTGGEKIELRDLDFEKNKPLIESLNLRLGVNWPIVKRQK